MSKATSRLSPLSMMNCPSSRLFRDQTNQREEQPYTFEAFDNCNDVAVFETRDTLYTDSAGIMSIW